MLGFTDHSFITIVIKMITIIVMIKIIIMMMIIIIKKNPIIFRPFIGACSILASLVAS